jgi:hypothetical protein
MLIHELAKPPQWQFLEAQLLKKFLEKFDVDYASAHADLMNLVQQECVKRISVGKYELTRIGRQKVRQQ